MSFDSVSADLVLKIFHQLPFKDRIRLSGVNRLFRDASMESINKMKSLNLNDRNLLAYSTRSPQSFISLLESCSSTLESIDTSTCRSCYSKPLHDLLPEFVYPNLKYLKIIVVSNNQDQVNKLLSRSHNLRSIVMELHEVFEWPENFVFGNLEHLEIHKCCIEFVNLSSILRPLIGNVSGLTRLTITGEIENLSFQEFSQLLASTPCLQVLHLRLYEDEGIKDSPFVKMCQDFITTIPTWRLPFLTSLTIDLADPDYAIPSSIFHNFPTAFPRLKSFKSWRITEIDDRAIKSLSCLMYLRELRLPYLSMSGEEFITMITSLKSISILEISILPFEEVIDADALQALSQLENLRELKCQSDTMNTGVLIDLITNVPSIAILEIEGIFDVDSLEVFMGFLMLTTALFHRNLEIQLSWMRMDGSSLALEQIKASLEEMNKTSGGPVIEISRGLVTSIRYSP